MAKEENILNDFYNRHPFPDFDLSRYKCRADLEASANGFARLIDRSIPEEASIIDVGCGTGQLISFLSIKRKKVVGVDFSDASLAKAVLLKKRLGLKVDFIKADIEKKSDMQKLGSYDCVLCLGVLHHLSSPEKSFTNISGLLKPGGIIALGLYNRCGRAMHNLKKKFSKMPEKKSLSAFTDTTDPKTIKGAWYDQYRNPKEHVYSIGQSISMLCSNSLEYKGIVPALAFEKRDIYSSGAWGQNADSPGFLSRAITQLSWFFSASEGGYFIIFGKKRDKFK